VKVQEQEQGPLDRRRFLVGSTAAGIGLALHPGAVAASGTSAELAIQGGKPVRTGPFSPWPIYGKPEEEGLRKALHSGKWTRAGGRIVKQFEESFAEQMGARYCVATSSGTGALLTALTALDVQAGDEVILPPYTFVACVNVILMRGALPVFVDIDPHTFQLDVSQVEAAITERTTCLMPVHIGGAPVDMDELRAVAKKHQIPVVEDACQAHAGEWRGNKLGTLTQAGCFSFQASKNINSGEGGAILFQDKELYERCAAFQANGRRPGEAAATEPGYQAGFKLAMTEFQGGILEAQLDRLMPLAQRRSENAEYLTKLLQDTPGIEPARVYPGCTRNAYHLYMMRYGGEHFANIPRSVFLRALAAEGVPASSGYRALNQEPFLAATLQSRGFQRLFSAERIAEWHETNRCPANDRLCEEAIWLGQNVLLGTRQDMEQIAEAFRKVQRNADKLSRS
jgi:perosamine synthetase